MSKWEMVRLGDVCKFINGDRGKNYPSAKDFVDAGIPFINAGHIKGKSVDYSDMNYISKDKYEKLGSGKIEMNDILYCLRGSLGKHAIVENSIGAIASSLVILRRNPEKIDVRYLLHSLSSKTLYNQQIRANNGSSQPNLSAASVKEFKIPLPPLNNQKHIADTLDKTQEIIDVHQKQLEELDYLIKAVFNDMFGDPFDKLSEQIKVPLIEIVDIIMGQSPKGDSYNNEGVGTPLLNGPTEFGTVHPIEKQWTNQPTKLCKEDDILFCVRGATAGRMNIADKQYCIGRGLAAIRVNDKDVKEYVYSYLGMMYDYFQSTSNGSTFINISKNQLETLPIIYPSKEKQLIFSKIVSNIEEQKSIVGQSLEESQTLFNSLMSKYFDE